MKYGYYPGCSLEGISAEYDESMRSLFQRLEVAVEDLPGWICCGTVAAPSMSRRLGLATPGHARAVRGMGFSPLFAQQSIREMTRTGRTGSSSAENGNPEVSQIWNS